jgi:hypothetical protein
MMLFAPAGEVRRRVGVAVGGVSAAAGEQPVGKRQIASDGTALRAELARRVPTVSDHELASVPALFVAQQPRELAPAGIGNRAGETMVAQHPGHVEIFDHKPVVGLDQRVGDLVQEMPTHIGDVVVMPTKLGSGLAAVA